MKLDLLAFAANSTLVLLYYLYLKWQTRRSPLSSVYAVNARIREQWVEMVMRKDNHEILAVQTLRNSVMAANFMASTSILLIIGSLNLGEKISDWALHWHPYQLAADFSSEIWRLKLCLLLLDFSIAFYSFSMSIRFFNHVGYMINLKDAPNAPNELTKLTCHYLDRAGVHYSVGTRIFFFSFPIILWFFGPIFLTIGTLCMVTGLVALDKIPT